MNNFKTFKKSGTNNLISKMNLSRKVADHLVGEDHTIAHRRVIGVGIMVFGVMVAKTTAHIDFFIIHILGDGIGYFLHAVGAIPFIKMFEHSERKLLNNNETTE